MIDPTYGNINRLLGFSFKNDDDDLTKQYIYAPPIPSPKKPKNIHPAKNSLHLRKKNFLTPILK